MTSIYQQDLFNHVKKHSLRIVKCFHLCIAFYASSRQNIPTKQNGHMVGRKINDYLSFFPSASCHFSQKPLEFVLPRIPTMFTMIYTAFQWRKYDIIERFLDENTHRPEAHVPFVTWSPWV